MTTKPIEDVLNLKALIKAGNYRNSTAELTEAILSSIEILYFKTQDEIDSVLKEFIGITEDMTMQEILNNSILTLINLPKECYDIGCPIFKSSVRKLEVLDMSRYGYITDRVMKLKGFTID